MSKRITISVEDNIADADALQLALQVVGGGKISGNGKHYCYATEFKHPNYNETIMVYTSPRVKEQNVSFTIMKTSK